MSMRLFLHIESVPGALARVLEPLAVSGYAPHTLFLRPAARGAAFVMAEFEGPDAARAALLTERLRQMPCVMRARLAGAQ
jgi:hypothetical protein